MLHIINLLAQLSTERNVHFFYLIEASFHFIAQLVELGCDISQSIKLTSKTTTKKQSCSVEID